ncbi:SH3 domain-containing protein [Denitrobaculum tricleocarpae]|uniref:SH3 domain-containing protein n=1 Tax=Denitrobaculum tricleocarpae TaxID=2591009 RepID=A0A545TY11_9PROT|nr:SH3 domain-containing protein [Denitrobaculum tricleocarpae]TQV82100.1 hypothetical protein FKG95_07695 [Denitrobaculum tricleocarpae]
MQSWTQSYSPALSVRAGETVTLGAKDADWPEWIWCRNSEGLGGWLPASSLSSQTEGEAAKLLTDFDTIELTVKEGEELEGVEERGGWIWCRSHIGMEGWVPLDHVEPFDPS